MIKNYIKIAFANLIKSKVYSSISIFSLSIGMAVSILLLIYVTDELSYDRYNEKADNIYRLCHEEDPYQAPQIAKFLTDKLPQIKESARILIRGDMVVQYKKLKFNEPLAVFVDADLLQMFSFKFKFGNAKTALNNPETIVISEKAAQKYFGNENPIGKLLILNNEYKGTITGVFENMPHNSHFRYDFLISLAGANNLFGEESMNHWGWQNFLVYFEMQDQFSKPETEAKISELVKDAKGDDALTVFKLQNLKDIHLYSSHMPNDIQPQNSITYVLIFSAIALLILLIASFNYINLLTANATTRVTEIGVRKTFGASRSQLANQFISESIVVFLISLLVALLLVNLSLPIFNSLAGKELSILSLLNGNIILGITGMMIVLGVLAGWYPAFILSSYSPTKVMKSNKNMGSGFQIKKILVGVQFTIVIVLIAGSLIMLRQINFLQNKSLGFDKEYVLVANVNDYGDEAKYLSLKQVLLEQSIVNNVSTASRLPSGRLNNWGAAKLTEAAEWIHLPIVHVQFDYFKTLGIKTTQGRLFSDKFKTDTTESVILNEAAVSYLGIQGNPIGQRLICTWPLADRGIVGVIDDIHFESLHEKIKPVFFIISQKHCSRLIVKVNPSNASNVINILKETSKKIYPDEMFDFRFMDVRLEQLYQKDENTFQLMGYFAIIAIFLASMGLLGMASFMMTSRTKEIGIRKVNGAKVSEIMRMLNISFVKWMGISFVIATPIAYYSMSKWMESFAYKAELSWWIFVLAGFISLVVVLLTVSGLTYRAARRNPVEALRYE
ncbi:MAG: FtsX-like permease family protein [Bacteroidota bacterium]